ncbi:hypothetical protein DIZ27_38870 [Streptomyces sp. NWU339]|uniref:hypothetical protein n=1 Tax=Streptomyces sp. NWU339 TaxID=2185284 RepID=UPI000D67ECD9|nr:hypothetical protein [Streptomyces sp. NWU339]PWI05498.1 hypothetical protein DIZ27_38870 [Streptomyces sp. NWU339]
MTQSFETFKGEIERALSACGLDPYRACDVNAAAAFLDDDQDTNAPDDFWTVIRRYRTPQREAVIDPDDLELELTGGCGRCGLEADMMCAGCGRCNCDRHDQCKRPARQ